MFRPGAYVADHVSPTSAEQVQPNGVDLTLAAVFVQREAGRIARDGKTVGDREPVEPETGGVEDAEDAESPNGDAAESVPTYRLEPGGYVVRYGEAVRVPEGHVGFVLPRSSLMRNSCMMNTAVWDAGYEGRGEGLLEVHHEIAVEEGARVAQFVLAAADHATAYDGTYQGENL